MPEKTDVEMIEVSVNDLPLFTMFMWDGHSWEKTGSFDGTFCGIRRCDTWENASLHKDTKVMTQAAHLEHRRTEDAAMLQEEAAGTTEPFIKSKVLPITDRGETIENPGDGFIVVGNIYVAQLGEDGKPQGGLIGHKYDVTQAGMVHEMSLHRGVYTKRDILRALGYSNEDLRRELGLRASERQSLEEGLKQ